MKKGFCIIFLLALVGCATMGPNQVMDWKQTVIIQKSKTDFIKELPAKLSAIDYVIDKSSMGESVITTEWKFLLKKQDLTSNDAYYGRMIFILSEAEGKTSVEIKPKFEMRTYYGPNPLSARDKGENKVYTYEEYPWNFKPEMMEKEMMLVKNIIEK